MYDIIIIGAGAAGYTAGIYTTRRALNTFIISKDFGGQAVTTLEIENYPGFNKVSGPELMDKFKKQYEGFGGKLELDEIIRIEKIENVNEKDKNIDKKLGFHYKITTKSEKAYESKAVIMAFGVMPREMDVPGEQEFKNKGVSYCATCDGPLFKGKNIAVVGGGNSALDAAEFLGNIGEKIYLIHRRAEFRAEEVLVEKVKSMPNVELVLDTQVKEVKGSQFVEKIVVENKKGEKREIEVSAVFVEIGHYAKTNFVKDLVKLNEKGEIITDADCQTNVAGIFAAGDVTNGSYKQIVISAGEGAKAGLQAYKYLQELAGKKVVDIGSYWGR